MINKYLPTISIFIVSTFCVLWHHAFANSSDLGRTIARFSCTSPCSNSNNQKLATLSSSMKPTLHQLNNQPAIQRAINITQKSEPQLVAQSGSMQDAVDFIHRLKKEGKIEIGTDNTIILAISEATM